MRKECPFKLTRKKKRGGQKKKKSKQYVLRKSVMDGRKTKPIGDGTFYGYPTKSHSLATQFNIFQFLGLLLNLLNKNVLHKSI